EALTAEMRPVTHAVLQARGLADREAWRYLVLPLQRSVVDAGTEEVAAVTPTSGPGESPTWRFTVGDPDQPIAVAELSLGGTGCRPRRGQARRRRRTVLDLVGLLEVGDHPLKMLLVAGQIVVPERVLGGPVLFERVVQQPDHLRAGPSG